MLDLPEIQAKIAQGTVTKEEMQEVVKYLRGEREIAGSVREIKKERKNGTARKADLGEWLGVGEGDSPTPKSDGSDKKSSVFPSVAPAVPVLDSFLAPSK